MASETRKLMSTKYEESARSLDRCEMAVKEDELKANYNTKSSFFQQLQTYATEFIELTKHCQDSLTEEERGALFELSKEKSIVISKADKGNAVVIQDVVDYRNKVSKILSDSKKFSKLKKDPTIARERDLRKLVNSYSKASVAKPDKRCKSGIRAVPIEHHMSREVVRRITMVGSRAGVMYGLPKIHKDDKSVPLRPIISAVRTYNYNLAKYLVEILSPLVENSENAYF